LYGRRRRIQACLHPQVVEIESGDRDKGEQGCGCEEGRAGDEQDLPRYGGDAFSGGQSDGLQADEQDHAAEESDEPEHPDAGSNRGEYLQDN
jgi:hypothetical protein